MNVRDVRPSAVYDVVVHGSVFLGAVTVAKLAVAYLLLPVGWNAAVVVGVLLPVGVYNLDKVADRDVDGASHPGRAAFVAGGGDAYAACSGAALVVGVAVAVAGGLDAVLVTLFPVCVAAAYSVSWLPSAAVSRLKDVPLASTLAVAVAWAVPVAWLPLAFADESAPAVAGVVAGLFLLRTAIAAEVRNVRDLESDRIAGVRTLPLLVGVRPTRWVCYALDALSLALVARAAAAGLVPRVAPLALLPAVGFSLSVTARTRPSADLVRLCTLRDLEYPLMAGSLAVALSRGVW